MRRLADALSLLRIALVPVFLILAWLTQHPPGGPDSRTLWRVAALAVLSLSGVSDWLDGYFARRSGGESRWGPWLDAIGDRAAQLSVVAFFAIVEGPAFPVIPFWFLGVIVARDLLIGGGALVLRATGREPIREHRLHGRVATFLMFFFLLWITADFPLPGNQISFVAFSVLLLGSAVLYLVEDVRRLARS